MSGKDRGKRIASPPETLEIAVSLARIGWPVFPVSIYEAADGTRSKVPAVKWKEWATTDVKAVAKAWAGEHSGRWIGVYAGKAGIVVLDLDPAKKAWTTATGKVFPAKLSGRDSIAKAGLDIVDTFNYPTHRKGGRHYVYAAPEGLDLTIGADIVVDGVKLEGADVRSGNGLMIYYGPELTPRRSCSVPGHPKGRLSDDGRTFYCAGCDNTFPTGPDLAPAPDWILVERGREAYNGGTDRDPSATEERFRSRLNDGKPKKKFAKLIRSVEFPKGAAHEPMLEVVAALVGEGVRHTPGVLRLLDETRERYVHGGADRARDWENAVDGSVRRFGLPLPTLTMTKAERKAIEQRNAPAAIEERKAERKGVYRASKHKAAIEAASDPDADRPLPGDRVLEDAALADELANVLRGRWAFADGYGVMRYVKKGKHGGRWKAVEEHSLVEAIRRHLVSIEIDEHTAAAMRGDNKAIDKARTLLSRSRAAAVGRFVIGILAEDEPVFDAHPDLLNTPSGVVDLRTGELSDADPMLYLTKMTDAPYDPKADMTMWEAAATSLPPQVVDYLQVRLGQGLTGYTPDDDTLVIFEGAGENGKTAWLIGYRKALGDYARKLPDRLMVGDPGDHPTTLMTLMGARAGIIEELPEGRQLNVKRLKDVVGTPEITARKMRQDDVTFPNTTCIFLATNYLPIVAETDHGTWRRLVLIRFRHTYVKRKRDVTSARHRVGDPKIKRHFEHHADAGLLRWLVEGARRWYELDERMPAPPKIVRKDTASWRLDADPILAYVRERIVHDEGFAITTTDLAADFNRWLEARGHRPWTSQTINSRFQGHVSMDGVERKMVKFSARVAPSRPRSVLAVKPIPKSTTSWRGIRFEEEQTSYMSEAERDAAALREMEERLG
jgi:putative DNA primase/helicase